MPALVVYRGVVPPLSAPPSLPRLSEVSYLYLQVQGTRKVGWPPRKQGERSDGGGTWGALFVFFTAWTDEWVLYLPAHFRKPEPPSTVGLRLVRDCRENEVEKALVDLFAIVLQRRRVVLALHPRESSRPWVHPTVD
eukprot:736780-Prymnesium_polylepis.1